MPTDSTIGTGGDFSTISLWIASLPADLAGTGRHIGRCFNQEFDEEVRIEGNANPSVDDYIELTAADGASFADDETNRLDLVESQGAYIDWTGGSWDYAVRLSVEYTRLTRLQIKRGGANEYGIICAVNTTIDRCIIEGRNRPVTPANMYNSLVIAQANIDNILCRTASQTQLEYVTAVADPFDNRTRSIMIGNYSTPRVKNLAGFGQNNLYNANISSLSGDSTTNASDTADNLTGSDLTNVTYNRTEPFVDAQDGPTTDYKIFAGSALEGAGQPSSIGITTDIFGRPRPSSNPSIGCHESQSVGPAPEATQNAIFMGHDW